MPDRTGCRALSSSPADRLRLKLASDFRDCQPGKGAPWGLWEEFCLFWGFRAWSGLVRMGQAHADVEVPELLLVGQAGSAAHEIHGAVGLGKRDHIPDGR